MTGRHGSLRERFMAKLPTERPEDACWPWQAAKSPKGYGKIRGGLDVRESLLAHRVSYELFVGPIPAGMHLDHRCHTDDPACFADAECPHRACVNPRHLEPVVPRVNILRGRSPKVLTVVTDVCDRGHAFSANAYTHPKTGKRQCTACRRVRRAAGAA